MSPIAQPSNSARLALWRDGCRQGTLAPRVDRPRSLWRRSMGLLVRPPLAQGEALWLDPCGGIHTWGMQYAIDVLFLSRDGEVLGVARDVHPWRMIFAPRGTRSVIELRAGEAHRVRVGDRIVGEP